MILIINADDLGYDPAVTRGILESMTRGAVTSTTLMVNGPHSADAGDAVRGKGLGIGLHFNLARWAPVSAVPSSLLGADGGFSESKVGALTPEVVEAEALAQLQRLEALTGRAASHVDVHKHLHRHASVLEGLLRAASAMKLPVRSIDAAMRAAIQARGVATNDHFIGDARDDAYWTLQQLRAEVAALPGDGVVELMCHPGYVPTTLKSGYSAQREVELATFVSDEARALLAAHAPVSWWAVGR